MHLVCISEVFSEAQHITRKFPIRGIDGDQQLSCPFSVARRLEMSVPLQHNNETVARERSDVRFQFTDHRNKIKYLPEEPD